MSSGVRLFRSLRDLFLIAFVLAGVLGASQVPGFVQEYQQRVGGARDEVSHLLDQFASIAEKANETLDVYVGRLLSNSEASVRQTGREIAELAERRRSYDTHLVTLENGGRFEKPWIMVRYGDREVIEATWRTYRHTLTLDPEFAAIGLVVGWFLYGILAGLLRAIFPGRRYNPQRVQYRPPRR